MPNLWKGEWEEMRTLGRGGQGDVRLVKHVETGELGTLKKLKHENNVERRKRLHIEAETLHVLDHTSIAIIRIFPNQSSAWRLVGAVLAKKHEEWWTGQRYLKMDEYYDWLDEQADTGAIDIESKPTNRTLQPA